MKTFWTIKPLVAQKFGKMFFLPLRNVNNQQLRSHKTLIRSIDLFFDKKVSNARRPLMSFRFKVRKTTE